MKKKTLIVLLLINVVWAGTYPATKYLMQDTPFFLVTSLRYLIALAPLLLLAWLRYGLAFTAGDLLRCAVIGIATFTLCPALMYYGVGTVAVFDGWLSAGYTAGPDFEGGLAMLGADYPISRVTRVISELWIELENTDYLLFTVTRFELDFMSIDVGVTIPLTGQSGDYFQYLPWLGGTFVL